MKFNFLLVIEIVLFLLGVTALIVGDRKGNAILAVRGILCLVVLCLIELIVLSFKLNTTIEVVDAINSKKKKK